MRQNDETPNRRCRVSASVKTRSGHPKIWRVLPYLLLGIFIVLATGCSGGIEEAQDGVQ